MATAKLEVVAGRSVLLLHCRPPFRNPQRPDPPHLRAQNNPPPLIPQRNPVILSTTRTIHLLQPRSWIYPPRKRRNQPRKKRAATGPATTRDEWRAYSRLNEQRACAKLKEQQLGGGRRQVGCQANRVKVTGWVCFRPLVGFVLGLWFNNVWASSSTMFFLLKWCPFLSFHQIHFPHFQKQKNFKI